jgi:hypothetical protein
MTDDEYNKYWQPVSGAMFEKTQKMLEYLEIKYQSNTDGFLGDLGSTEEFWQSVVLTDKLKETLKILAGPYGQALWKMLEIQNRLAKDKTTP